MENLIIVGTSTNAEHSYKFVREYSLYNVLGFAVNEQYKTCDTFLNLPVFTLENLGIDTSNVKFYIGMLWDRLNANRRKVFETLKAAGYKFANLISPYARIHGKIAGTNIWVHDFAVIQNGAVIEDNVSIMTGAVVGSHSTIHRHCFLGAKSIIGGGLTSVNKAS